MILFTAILWSWFPPSYFEDDEEESSSADLPYIPAENSPTRQQMQSGGGGRSGGGEKGSDSDDDPLDAFMAEVEVRSHTHHYHLLSQHGTGVVSKCKHLRKHD